MEKRINVSGTIEGRVIAFHQMLRKSRAKIYFSPNFFKARIEFKNMVSIGVNDLHHLPAAR